MAKAVPSIALRPSAATLTLTRPVGFKPVSVSIGLDGSAVRLLVPEEIAARLFETVLTAWMGVFSNDQNRRGLFLNGSDLRSSWRF